MSSFLERTYHLKESPFKQKSAFFDLLPTWANREEQIKQWNKILDDSVKTTSANYIVLIVGDYGMGKSLSLLKIYQEAKDRKIHYPVLTTFLSEQRIKNPGLDFIFRIFRQIDFKDFNIKKESLDVLNELDPEVKIIFNHILFGNEDIKKIALAYFRGEISPTQKQLKDLEVIRKITDLDLLLLYLIGLLYIIKKSGFSNFTIIIDEFEYVFSLVSRSSQP
ncbi:MAG: DUF2791 family P-loop domain-containing protein, partial [Nanoarchaeota archaeon]|nr:DUF2791 family P-loop domain-containing protein [Nanoarchaeota archaeon]